MTPKARAERIALYRRIFERFRAPVSRFDCGRKCAPHNGGEPVCCSTQHAIPIADRAEFELLRARTDLWRRYRAIDAESRREIADLHRDCVAIECKGARHCERDNRTMACRAFPFFPYLTRAGELVGLSYFWAFEDRCWIISNLGVVTPDFVRECIEAYELLFAADRLEYDANRRFSASMRRVFARRERLIPVIGRDGALHAVEPRTHALRPATLAEFPKFGPYKDDALAAADEAE
jgi:hypothetical protein